MIRRKNNQPLRSADVERRWRDEEPEKDGDKLYIYISVYVGVFVCVLVYGCARACVCVNSVV